MKSPRIIVFAGAGFILLFGYMMFRGKGTNDWNRLCEVATKAASQSTNGLEQRSMIAKAIAENGPWSRKMLLALKTASAADPTEKSTLLRSAASDEGFKQWTCPALEDQ